MATEDYFDLGQMYYSEHETDDDLMNDEVFPMARQAKAKTAKKRIMNSHKTIMVKIGRHLVDPTDISAISKIKDRDLYVIRLKSQPNMEYPIWANAGEVSTVMSHFDIQE